MDYRLLTSFEKKQRGCQYCLHVTLVRYNGDFRNGCPFDKCQYEVLDKYKTYEEYMASEDSMILVNEYFQTLPSCYELSTFSHAPRGIFVDKGDFKMHL